MAAPVHSDSLLHELRHGERDAFVRYYELYRAPVYNLVRWLLHGDDDAMPATVEVFTRAYRRILLDADGNALPELTYTAALDICRERLGEREADRGAALGVAPGADMRKQSDVGRRFGQALEMLPFDYQAALRLHDFNGLRSGEMAIVFGVTEDAAGALLFRAREAFRRTFEELSSDRRAATCRLAEQAAAGAVGRSLSDDEIRRLDEHAGYCRHCRRAVKGWGGGAIGLAMFLEDAPLPQELETTPVFGTTSPIAGALGAVAGSGTLVRVFARIGRPMTSRAAAYALAAACLALSVGLAAQLSRDDQVLIVPSAAAPKVLPPIPSATSLVRPPISLSGLTVATSALAVTGSSDSAESHSGARERTLTALADAGAPEPTLTTVADAGAPEPTLTAVTDAGTLEPTSASVADLGDSAGSGSPTIGRPVASSLGGAGDVTPKGDTKGAAKATHKKHLSAVHGHAGRRNVDRAERAGTHHGKAAKHAAQGGRRRARAAAKQHAGKHHAHKKSKKNH